MGQGFQIGGRQAIFQAMGETKLESWHARRVASKLVASLRGGVDIRGKVSAPIRRVPRRDLPPKPKSDDCTSAQTRGSGRCRAATGHISSKFTGPHSRAGR